jgi:hypothetical protein
MLHKQSIPSLERRKKSALDATPKPFDPLKPSSAQNSSSSWKNMVKLMIVPYMSKPPTTLISMAA